MNLLRRPVRFFGLRFSILLSPLCSYTTIHPAAQNLLKQIYKSPSVLRRLRRFFKSISWITSSSARVSSVSRKQNFCNTVTASAALPTDGRRPSMFSRGSSVQVFVLPDIRREQAARQPHRRVSGKEAQREHKLCWSV